MSELLDWKIIGIRKWRALFSERLLTMDDVAENGDPLVIHAAKQGRNDLVSALLRMFPCETAKDASGRNLVSCLLSLYESEKSAIDNESVGRELLLSLWKSHPAEFFRKDERGWNPFLSAFMEGNWSSPCFVADDIFGKVFVGNGVPSVWADGETALLENGTGTLWIRALIDSLPISEGVPLLEHCGLPCAAVFGRTGTPLGNAWLGKDWSGVDFGAGKEIDPLSWRNADGSPTLASFDTMSPRISEDLFWSLAKDSRFWNAVGFGEDGRLEWEMKPVLYRVEGSFGSKAMMAGLPYALVEAAKRSGANPPVLDWVSVYYDSKGNLDRSTLDTLYDYLPKGFSSPMWFGREESLLSGEPDMLEMLKRNNECWALGARHGYGTAKKTNRPAM